jgi:hypothetical protein
MTSLLSPPRSDDVAPARPRLRSLVAISATGGLAAALVPLVLCGAVAVVGWFLADAGSHGEPRDALRVAALGWLVAHGSGVTVAGVALTALPLLVTLGCAWAVWRCGRRVGEAVSAHGPDADLIADGQRDWTVPVATAVFTGAYLAVLATVLTLVSTPASTPSAARAAVGAVALCGLVGGAAVAVGSGRASVWVSSLPAPLRASATTCLAVLRWYAGVSAGVLLLALLLDAAAAANILSQLRTDPTDTATVVVLSLLLVPNAVAFAGSYLLGPGFAVGAGTLVSPTVVVLGPLPLVPLLAALPGAGDVPAWTPLLLGVPPLVAAVASARVHRRWPTTRWDLALLRGGAGGVAAGLVTGVVAGLAGGAVGPGRMRVVGPAALDVAVHAVPAFAVGAVAGAVVMVWRERRSADRAADPRSS